MPRSPFSGTFSPNVRPTVVTAPDIIVYINGEMEVQGCPSCNRLFDINRYVTSVTVDLSVDSPPGSASVSLSLPRHTIDDFYFDGNPVITPMMEIEIYAKGYFVVEGLPQYYPIFWGVTTEVNDAYSGGEHTISIHCADILKWWDICRMNVTPAFTAPAGQQGRSIFGNVYYGTNPFDIIWSLALQSYGDVLIGTGSLISLYKEAEQRPTFTAALSDLMLYWEKRFSRIRSNLMLYGTNGIAVRGDSLYQFYSRGNKGEPRKPFASAAVRNANGGPDAGQMGYDPTDPSVSAFRTNFGQAGEINFWQSEYQTKLELANAAKEAIGYEFFMDVTGDIVFKPPFYNLDIFANKPISWVQDIDIIDWDFSESEAEVVTQIVLQGSMYGNVDYGLSEECTPFTSVTDYHLLRKYGWRSHPYNSEFLGDPQLMFYHGMDMLDRINSKRHRASITIPMRPELRLGFPIYIAPKDQIWYISGISHNLSFGGRATTTLTLTAKRAKFIAPKGIGSLKLKGFNDSSPTNIKKAGNADNLSFPYTSRQLSRGATFELKVGAAGTLPPDPSAFDTAIGADNPYEPLILRHPKTGRIVGYPNVVMIYTRPFSNADFKTAAGQKPKPNPNSAKKTQDTFKNLQAQQEADIDAQFTVTQADALRDRHVTNRYQYGLTSAGAYIYAHDSSRDEKGVIGEILTLPSANLQVTPAATGSTPRGKTALIRPVSDERGFEVVGHYRYGRRVALRDGRLVLKGNTNTKANIDFQFALGGGLFETLTAQSQGLTAISTAYANPADQIARMQPDDLQTAAVKNPETGQPQFTDVGDNFVDVAPLGSPEQKGVQSSVEAGQLSRALTLAEMTVKEQGIQSENCPCILGRSDLAFINVGYQVSNVNPSAPDNTTLFNAIPGSSRVAGGFGNSQILAASLPPSANSGANLPVQVGQEQQIETNIAALRAQLDQVNDMIKAAQGASVNQPPAQTSQQQAAASAKTAKIRDLEAQARTLQSRIDSANQTLNNLQVQQTNEGAAFPTGTTLTSRVEQFLTNLYKALDAPHQQYEKAIRGDLLPGGASSSAKGTDVETPSPLPSEFAPPFNAPSRFQLGDHQATVGAIQSNADNLSKAWSDFGTNLKSNAQKSVLSQQIATGQGNLVGLQNQLTALKKQQSDNVVIIGTDVQGQINSLNQQISSLQQDIRNKQMQLSQLPSG